MVRVCLCVRVCGCVLRFVRAHTVSTFATVSLGKTRTQSHSCPDTHPQTHKHAHTQTHTHAHTHTHTCTEPGTKSLVRLTESFRLLDSNHVSLKLKTSLTQGTASSFALPHLLDTRHSSYLLSLSPPSPSILPWKRKASDVGIFQDTHRELLSER